MDDRSLEELETLQDWWDKNGKVTIITFIIIVGSFIGWLFYKKHQESRVKEAADLSYYVTIDSKDKELSLNKLIESYPDLAITQLDLLIESKKIFDGNDLDKAYGFLNIISQNSKDPFIKDVAILRGSRILMQNDKLIEAKNYLNQVLTKELLPIKLELLGDISQLEGNKEDAFNFYKDAIHNMKFPKTSLILKFNDLGGTNESNI